ncbi:MAG: OmpA family protein [Bacteroidales bacterium]
MKLKIMLFFLIALLVPVWSIAQQKCDVEISPRSERYYKKALKKYLDADFRGASDLLKKAIEASPENYQAHLLKANMNVNTRNPRGSIRMAFESYKRVVEICPEADVKAYYYIAEIYYGREEWEKAANNYELFLSSDMQGQKRVTEDDIRQADQMLKKAKFNHRILSNKVPFNPKPVRDVSTERDEYLAIISPDHEKMFFTRRVEEIDRTNVYESADNYVEKFMLSRRKADNVFDQGTPLDYPFNQRQNEGAATITIDNKDLYLTICQYVKGYYNCDICHSHYDGEFWSEIRSLGDQVNNEDTWEAQPSISSDGKKIYFVSDRSGGYGGYDIYFTTKDSSGNWSKATNAGPAINTSGDEASPYIHTDSQTLYFSSRDRYEESEDRLYPGHQGLGGYDVFYIRLGEQEKMKQPKNLGYPINTKDDEVGFFVSTDGTKGYFATNKYSDAGDYDIFYFDLYDEVRPEKVLFLKGTLTDDQTNQPIQDAKIELKSVESKQVEVIDVDQQTGEYVAAMPFKEDYVMTVKSKEHVYQSHYLSRKQPSLMKPVEVDIKLEPMQVGKSYRLNDIYFDTDSVNLTGESMFVLRDFVDYLKDNKAMQIAIHGYTDNVGSAAYNLKLSRERAKAVYQTLVEMGVPENQLEYEGFGEANPVADNTTEEGRAKNRRTEFVIKKF